VGGGRGEGRVGMRDRRNAVVALRLLPPPKTTNKKGNTYS